MWYKGSDPPQWAFDGIVAAVNSIEPGVEKREIDRIVRDFWADRQVMEADLSGGMKAFFESDHWVVMNEVRQEIAKRAHFFAGGGTRKELEENPERRSEWATYLRDVLGLQPALVFAALCRSGEL
jgi:hypothetical protein